MSSVLRVALVIILVFLLSEMGIRVVGIPLPPPPRELAVTSLEYAPSVYSKFVFPHLKQEKSVRFQVSGIKHYHINSLGYRGEEFNETKNEKEFRVMIYGGSSVFDITANEGEDWPALTQKVLHAQNRSHVRIINAGVPGLTSLDTVGRLLTEGHRFKPDIIMYSGLWNDIKLFQQQESLLHFVKPYATGNNPFITPYGIFDDFLCNNSQLYLVVRTFFLQLWIMPTEEGAPMSPPKVPGIKEEALAQYRLSLTTFIDIAHSIGAVPILMTEPRLATTTLSPELMHKVRLDYVQMTFEQLLEAYIQGEAIVREVARSKQIPIIDASAELSGNPSYFHDHVHTTSEGSRALATLVAQNLKKMIPG